jgi:antimicrobial peptide system SdpB family protein
MLSRLGTWARDAVVGRAIWTDVYGVARSLLALSTALTLAVNPTATLFLRGAVTQADPPLCNGLRAIDPFCLVPAAHLEVARWLCVLALLVVASGWRPRLTGVMHWWIAFGLHGSANILDGGDNVCAVLTLLLVPVTLTDRRAWHWQRGQADDESVLVRLVAWSALLVIRLQISGIYFHAALAKTAVAEWGDGTALYYWLLHDEVGAPRWLVPLAQAFLRNPVAVTLMTWSVVILEFLLSAALLMPKRRWRPLLFAGLALHAGILVVQGLFSFSLAMAGALFLYLRPTAEPFFAAQENETNPAEST